MGWMDTYEDGGSFLGTTNEGFNYNGAWGGPAQNGVSMPGSVVFSYARTGAPSNGKYAKKTMPSAQSGKDIRKSSDTLRVPMWSAANQEEEIIPTIDKIIDIQKRDPLAKKAAEDFTSWYTNPETLKRFNTNTGLDPRRLGDLVGRALKTPSEQYASDDSNRLENNAQFSSPLSEGNKYGTIRYNKQEKSNPQLGDYASNQNAAIQHEFGHAGSVDDVLGPALMRVLGDPFKQSKVFSENRKAYLAQPQEAYGNFHQFRVELGLKPGQKIDIPTLKKLTKEKRLEGSNFYKTFDDDKIVKAINTIASTNIDDDNFQYANNGGVIEDDMGQWAHPGEVTKINSNNITMEGVPYPVLGISDTGDKKLMKPGDNYVYNGESVTEYPMAQNGSKLFFDQYSSSPKYKERLEKQGYTDPDKVIMDRKNHLSKTKLNVIPDIGGFTPKNTGSFYRPETNTVDYDEFDLQLYPGSTREDIVTHETSHALGSLEPNKSNLTLNRKETEAINYRNKSKQQHEENPWEAKADMDVLRYHLKKDKIYDTGTQDFTPELLKKSKQKYKDNETIKRFFNRFSDKDAVYLMNNIALADNDEASFSAKNGGELTKLDQLTNFTNYNKPQPGGWLDNL